MALQVICTSRGKTLKASQITTILLLYFPVSNKQNREVLREADRQNSLFRIDPDKPASKHKRSSEERSYKYSNNFITTFIVHLWCLAHSQQELHYL